MEAVAVLTQPNTRVWVVAPTYSGSEKVFREVWKELIIGLGWKPKRASEKDQYMEFDWGSTLEGKSADKPVSLVGESCNLLIIDECAKIRKKVWDMYLRPTLSDKKGEALFISTPEGFNWIYELYKREDQDWNSFRSPSWENHHAFPGGYDDSDLQEARRNLSVEVFNQEYGASFTALSGRVYNFDPDKDVALYKYNATLPTFCSIDFGYRSPCALWFQLAVYDDGSEHIHVIDEINHEHNIKSDIFARRILNKPYSVLKYYGDIAGGQVQGQSGVGDIELFRRHGINVRYARDRVSRSIRSGIDHIRGFFENADGVRRIHIDKNCKGFIKDLESYRYPEDKSGKPIKEEPLKDGICDHSMDAMRYFFINHFPIKGGKIRVIKR